MANIQGTADQITRLMAEGLTEADARAKTYADQINRAVKSTEALTNVLGDSAWKSHSQQLDTLARRYERLGLVARNVSTRASIESGAYQKQHAAVQQLNRQHDLMVQKVKNDIVARDLQSGAYAKNYVQTKKLAEEYTKLQRTAKLQQLVADHGKLGAALRVTTEHTRGFSSAAAVALGVTSAFGMSMIRSGMAGTVEAAQLELAWLRMSRAAAGIAQPAIELMTRAVEGAGDEFRSMDRYTQNSISQVALLGAGLWALGRAYTVARSGAAGLGAMGRSIGSIFGMRAAAAGAATAGGAAAGAATAGGAAAGAASRGIGARILGGLGMVGRVGGGALSLAALPVIGGLDPTRRAQRIDDPRNRNSDARPDLRGASPEEFRRQADLAQQNESAIVNGLRRTLGRFGRGALDGILGIGEMVGMRNRDDRFGADWRPQSQQLRERAAELEAERARRNAQGTGRYIERQVPGMGPGLGTRTQQEREAERQRAENTARIAAQTPNDRRDLTLQPSGFSGLGESQDRLQLEALRLGIGRTPDTGSDRGILSDIAGYLGELLGIARTTTNTPPPLPNS